METVIDIESLGLAYRSGETVTPIFEAFDLHVRAGEFVAIVGESGVGKSTLLRIIAGLLPPSAGRFRLNVPNDPTGRPVALVFQDARLLPWRRVLHNVMLGVEGLAVSRLQRRQRSLAALELVGLLGMAGRWPYQLSGGQRQRVALARALAVAPALLLMDEPFGALDAITRQTMQEELLRVWQATGRTILFVTHDIDEAVFLADRIIVLAGTPARIKAHYPVVLAHPRPRGHAETQQIAASIRQDMFTGFAAGDGI